MVAWILIILGFLAFAAASFLFTAWIVMLVWGLVGTTFFPGGTFSTVSYGEACVATLGLGVLGSFFRKA